MPSDTPTKVLIVDDHEIVRKGLVMLISRQEDLVVAGEAGAAAGAAAEAVQKAVSFLRMWWCWTSVCRTVRGRGLPRYPGRKSRRQGFDAHLLQ